MISEKKLSCRLISREKKSCQEIPDLQWSSDFPMHVVNLFSSVINRRRITCVDKIFMNDLFFLNIARVQGRRTYVIGQLLLNSRFSG